MRTFGFGFMAVVYVSMLSWAHSDQGIQLSYTSKDFLGIEDPASRAEYAASRRGVALKQNTVVTCMDVLCKSLEGDQAVSRCPTSD